MSYSADDYRFMGHALQLARRGLWTTSPNPRVGCVLVQENEIVGEGWHQIAGQPHAEVHALKMAGERAEGATAYVTLEPCCHQGRTPPCTEALIKAGIRRVVIPMVDPNPRVSGHGLASLQSSGISCTVGVMESEASELNVGFVSRMTRQRPWVRIKSATSLDGRTALLNGQSQWITGPEARQDGHRWRARACAIVTGIETVLADDPALTVRGLSCTRQPDRVVLDSQLRLSPQSRVLTVSGGKTRVVTTVAAPERQALLEAAGAEVIQFRPDAAGRIPLPELLKFLGTSGYNEIHVEAGPTLNGALISQGLADELLIYLAPTLLGSVAQGAFELPVLSGLEQAPRFAVHDVRRVGPDFCFRLRPLS